MEPRIRRSAILVCIGQLIAVVSLLINHPLAFIFFIALGALFVVGGIVYYLLSLVSAPPPQEASPQEAPPQEAPQSSTLAASTSAS
jgi:hypothetical protein